MNLSEAIQYIGALATGKPVTAADTTTFHHWLYNEATNEELQALAAAHESILMAAGQLPEHDHETAANIFSKLEALHEAEGGTPVRSIRRNYWWAAAAVILLLLAGGGFYLLKRPQHQHIAKVSTLQPGGNKAVLTLGNGQQIVLDSTANGNVMNANGLKIVKLDSGLIAYKGNSSTMEYHRLSTPRGGQFQLTLPDGTRVWLNSSSSLRYPTLFTGDDRTVELNGEGYFEVAKDAARPFIVKTGNVRVNVLGTSFNVMAYDDEDAIRTTLLAGAVQVSTPVDKVSLKPGQQASMNKAGNTFSISTPDLINVTAWIEGKFVFDKVNIKTIMRQLARWYDMDVEYAGNVDQIKFEGVISRKESAKDLLDAIAATGEVHFSINGNRVTVIPGKE